jgi:hypothetical protein
MIRDLAPAPPTKAPWIPEPALAFAQGGLTFMPVPAHTGGWLGKGCVGGSGCGLRLSPLSTLDALPWG